MPDNMMQVVGDTVQRKLCEAGLNHLKTGVRGKNISVYSEYEGSRENRCRFIQMSGKEFKLGMADHNGKWESTPFEGSIDELLDMVMTQFGWVLTDYSMEDK